MPDPSLTTQPPSAPQNADGTGAPLTPLQARITELGKQENDRVAEQRRRREDFARRGEFLVRDVPPAFFALCTGLREAVARFNAQITEKDPALPIRYEETPGVTLRDANNDDLRVTVVRKFARFELRLRMMSRAGKPPVPLIEGDGAYGADPVRRVLLRIEGWVENGKTIFWYSLDFKRLQIDLSEVADRIVMSVIQMEPSAMSRVRLGASPAAPTSADGGAGAENDAGADQSGDGTTEGRPPPR